MDCTGFAREDGGIGIRNRLLILPSVSCANDVARKIAAMAPGAVAVTHQHGCGHLLDADIAQTQRTLVGSGRSPNVGACLVVGLGCELLDSSGIAGAIAASGKRVEFLRIQDHGGAIQTVADGAAMARTLQAELAGQGRAAAFSVSDLTIGIAGNALKDRDENKRTGELCDALVALGATVLQGESSEFLFAQEAALERCADAGSRAALSGVFDRVAGRMRALGSPSPENIGREKLERMGKSHFAEVVPYGVKPSRKGLVHMDSSRFLPETVSGMVAAGAHIILAALPKGGAVASPISPTVDLRAADLQTPDTAGAVKSLLRTLRAVAGGELTPLELDGVNSFAIVRVGPST